jgi:hypothetical protein
MASVCFLLRLVVVVCAWGGVHLGLYSSLHSRWVPVSMRSRVSVLDSATARRGGLRVLGSAPRLLGRIGSQAAVLRK